MDPNNQNDQAFANFSYPTVGAQPGSVNQPAHTVPAPIDPELEKQLEAQKPPTGPVPLSKPDDLDSQISKLSADGVNTSSLPEQVPSLDSTASTPLSVAPPTFGSPVIPPDDNLQKEAKGGKNPLRSLAKKLSGIGGGLVEPTESSQDAGLGSEKIEVGTATDTQSNGPAVVLDQPAPITDSDLEISNGTVVEQKETILPPDDTEVGSVIDISNEDTASDTIVDSSVGSALQKISQEQTATDVTSTPQNELQSPDPLSPPTPPDIDVTITDVNPVDATVNEEASLPTETEPVMNDVVDVLTSVPEVPQRSEVEAPSMNFVQVDPDLSSGTDSIELPPVENTPDMNVQGSELTTGSSMSPSALDMNTLNVSSTVPEETVVQSVGATLPSLMEEGSTTGPSVTELAAEDRSTPTSSSKSRYPYTIEQLLDIVVERDASDLHLTVGYPAMIRVDGELINVIDEPMTPSQALDLVLPVLPEQKKELLEVNREVDLAYSHRGTARFRINAYYQQQSLAGAFRLIPNRIRNIDELQLPQVYHQITKLKQGLVLVTGPTGSGKSTTLAAILQEINESRPDHIITIEDPVEYVFPKARAMVDQRELHEDTHSWEIALKSALRQDPDVMLVGEMRDFDTISSAITLAETGHLVFATLHTNSAAQTIDRIIDVFPEHQQSQVRSQLSNTIEAVIAQRLIPISAGGRRAVSEIMLATPAIRNLIRESKVHQIDNVIRTSADIGMISLEHSLVKLVRDNIISMEKAQEYAVHPEEVVRLLKS